MLLMELKSGKPIHRDLGTLLEELSSRLHNLYGRHLKDRVVTKTRTTSGEELVSRETGLITKTPQPASVSA